MNVCIFVPNWIGDAVMATPALRALRKHFARPVQITGVMRPHIAEVLAGTNWLDDQLYYDPRSPDPKLRPRAIVKELRARRFDTVIMLTNSLRTAAIVWASGAPRRIGYARYRRSLLLTDKLYHARRGRHWLPTPATTSYLNVAYAAGCGYASAELELATVDEDERAADQAWRELGLPPGHEVVVLNSGGAYGAAKHWPAEYFAALARRIVAKHERLSVLVNCGPAERPIAQEIVARAGHPRVVSLTGESLPLGLSKASIRRSRLLVTTDSGPRFFGVAFGVPTITLFGPTHTDWSRTDASHGETCLNVEVPCGPCHKRTCPLGHHRCMRELTVDRVFAAVERELRERPQQAAA